MGRRMIGEERQRRDAARLVGRELPLPITVCTPGSWANGR